MDEGRPTGIRRQDAESLAVVTFEGRRGVRLYDKHEDERGVFLELDPHEGPRLALYGYFDGDEFMEVNREPID